MVICLEQGADLHMAQLMPLPLTGFTFLVPAHPGSPGKRVVKWVCACVVGWGLAPQPTGELTGLALKRV